MLFTGVSYYEHHTTKGTTYDYPDIRLSRLIFQTILHGFVDDREDFI